jgi:kumamolisin
VAKIKKFAARHKLTVTDIEFAPRKVALRGSARSIGAAFGVQLLEYAEGPNRYRAQIGAVKLPPELMHVVTGVFGLDTRRQARPHIVANPAAAWSTPYTAPQVAGLYDFPGGLDGRGETIGLLEFGGGYLPADLHTYFGRLNLVTPQVTTVGINGAANRPGLDAKADSEVALDVEIAGAIAPGARLVLYFAPFTERGWVDALAAAVHDETNKPSVISISWGYSEGPAAAYNWTPSAVKAVNEILRAAAALGVTVCAACGDSGSNDGIEDGEAHVSFPASSPYVLACGGTSLTAGNEVVWNNGANSGTGGGISAVNNMPDWQKGVVPPSLNPKMSPGRGLPDVCGHADPLIGYNLFYGGEPHVLGGTSAVAPLWAGLLARINQGLGRPVGYFNPLLYSKLGRSPAFRDITVGNNDTTGRVGGYPAGLGWDACTGWGSPRGGSLFVEFHG